MKYYKDEKHLYLATIKGEIWYFHFSFPNSVNLGSIFSGVDKENKILQDGLRLENSIFERLNVLIEPNGLGVKGNLNEVVSILCNLYKLNKNEVYEYLNYNPLAVEVCQSLENVYDFERVFKYDDCVRYLKEYEGDIERVKKRLTSHIFRNDGTMVDVFPSEEDRERPTWPSESFLLHVFHRKWGDRLNELIKEAVKLYPDYKDVDLAAYYIQAEFDKDFEKRKKV